jgi:hypothetical protein
MEGTGEIKCPGRTKTGTAALQFDTGVSRARGLMGEKGLEEEDWTDRNNWRRKIA